MFCNIILLYISDNSVVISFNTTITLIKEVAPAVEDSSVSPLSPLPKTQRTESVNASTSSYCNEPAMEIENDSTVRIQCHNGNKCKSPSQRVERNGSHSFTADPRVHGQRWFCSHCTQAEEQKKVAFNSGRRARSSKS